MASLIVVDSLSLWRIAHKVIGCERTGVTSLSRLAVHIPKEAFRHELKPEPREGEGLADSRGGGRSEGSHAQARAGSFGMTVIRGIESCCATDSASRGQTLSLGRLVRSRGESNMIIATSLWRLA